jgi:glycosyltransferase involved in cell wall biosynthesis
MFMRYSLAILTLNEIDGIKELWDKIPFDAVDEAYVIDGGSTDGTLEYLSQKNAKVYMQERRGRGEAFRLGFEKSSCDVTIIFSPDGNEDPKDIERIVTTFESTAADMVIASRMLRESYNEEDSQVFRWRKWANNSFNLLANVFFNSKLRSNYISDSINGFRGIQNESFAQMNLNSSGYTIEYQSTIRAFKNKMTIVEFPTHEYERIGGESYAKSIPTGIRFIKCLFSELINHKDG